MADEEEPNLESKLSPLPTVIAVLLFLISAVGSIYILAIVFRYVLHMLENMTP
jgi:hypothetical protein